MNALVTVDVIIPQMIMFVKVVRKVFVIIIIKQLIWNQFGTKLAILL